MYIITDRWRFKVMQRKELEANVAEVRLSAMDSRANSLDGSSAPSPRGVNGLLSGAHTGKATNLGARTQDSCNRSRIQLLAVGVSNHCGFPIFSLEDCGAAFLDLWSQEVCSTVSPQIYL